jgi:hypothetical protein
MRILMLNNEFPPLGGGTGTVNQAMLACFAQMSGFEIDLVTSALKKSYEEESFAEKIRIYKVPVRNRNIHHSSNRELAEFFSAAGGSRRDCTGRKSTISVLPGAQCRPARLRWRYGG